MDENDGISPQAAGTLLAIVAALGLAFLGVALFVDYKSEDPLYDQYHPENQTSSKLQTTPDLWKKKEPVDIEPVAPPAVKRAATSNPG